MHWCNTSRVLTRALNISIRNHHLTTSRALTEFLRNRRTRRHGHLREKTCFMIYSYVDPPPLFTSFTRKSERGAAAARSCKLREVLQHRSSSRKHARFTTAVVVGLNFWCCYYNINRHKQQSDSKSINLQSAKPRRARISGRASPDSIVYNLQLKV